MSVFERSRAHVENEVMVRLLEHVDKNPQISQRTLSTQVGIAFGRPPHCRHYPDNVSAIITLKTSQHLFPSLFPQKPFI